MQFIPHQPIYLNEIRLNDIWLLLAVGALWEVACRLVLLYAKIKPASLLKKEDELDLLQQETNFKRKLGPSAFVETSKLERQVLALDKDLEQTYLKRRKTVEDLERILLRYGNMILSFTVFILYYGVPMLTLEGLEEGIGDYVGAGKYMRALLFPVSYIGFGVRISKWGLPRETAAASVGALVVMWSSQVTAAKLMDAIDAFFL